MFPKLPNGAEWKVELTKGDCDVWLQKGWDEFTKHHSINLGHSLVFRYEGNSHFFVLIFEPSATERDYPFDDKPQVPEMENIESDDNSVEIIDDFRPSRKTMEKSPSPIHHVSSLIRGQKPIHAVLICNQGIHILDLKSLNLKGQYWRSKK